ncbi:hypothetical protein EST38_g6348 [Candolleomyces aberdarensis]|uniref:Uncharacterized protein n=1 Tax=Candolleomyces aberdarensis TaxID=2316362 RepID=A0A4Q2DI03_9AGAR|nr:hypothetical protein EST38_g6348 [Candolleomyces aberdarensis]
MCGPRGIPPRRTLLEHAPSTVIESSDEEPSIEDGCAPEFARARRIERYVQRLMQDLKSKHHMITKEHEQFEELKLTARQVFSAVYMCKTELDAACEEGDWNNVRKVKNILYVCQEAIRGFSGDNLWEEKEDMDESH